ncbi:MAG: hypothetical protein D6715_09690 [Calditrichaeota bacterium]|nr:MAG: hypothetical protein D6715_09690 [Calditrichota bacterium]
MQTTLRFKALVLVLMLFASGSAQELGPFPLYVNKPTGQASSLEGQKSYTADCCESGTASITTQGPIQVTVQPELTLAPNQSKTWTGKVAVNLAGAPDPGQTIPAQFFVDYHFQYYDKNGNPTTSRRGRAVVKFLIHGVKVNLDPQYVVCQGGKIQITAREFPAGSGGEFLWTTTSNKIALLNADQKTVTVQAQGNSIGSVKLKCKYTVQGVSYETETTVIIFRLEARLSRRRVCDGATTLVQILPVPRNTPIDKVKACLQNIKVKATPTRPSRGNPIGHTNLPIQPVNNHLQARIDNAIWYSLGAPHCNDWSAYWIEVQAQCRCGNQNLTTRRIALATSASFRCINGWSKPGPRYFAGQPFIRVFPRRAGGFAVRIEQGTFRKAVQCRTAVFSEPNSQYRQMIINEENRHCGQFRGNTQIQAIRNKWNARRILQNANQMVAQKAFGTAQLAFQAGMRAFVIAYNLELRRSAQWNWPLRCQLEREAKRDIRATYHADMPCAYPNCH